MDISQIKDAYNQPNIKNTQQEKIYISKPLFEKAQNINKDDNKSVIIYANRVVAVDKEIFQKLKNDYSDGFLQYRGIFIAKDSAKDYLSKITDYVMDDLNIKNADKDGDGVITVAESLDAKNIISEGTNSILKPKDVLPKDVVDEMKKDNTPFISVNDLINLHIKLDKNRDGVVSIKEAKEDISEIGKEPGKASDELSKLYKRLHKLQKEIAELMLKMINADEDKLKILQEQVNIKNIELLAVIEELREKTG